MFAEKPVVHAALVRLARTMSHDPATQDDLRQEGLVHLYLMEKNNPGHRLRYYLQGCKFHMQDCSRRGCSIDSPKRSGLRYQSGDPNDTDDSLLHSIEDPDCDVAAQVTADDLKHELFKRLRGTSPKVLYLLFHEVDFVQICRKLNISRREMERALKHIARAAIKLDLLPSVKTRSAT